MTTTSTLQQRIQAILDGAVADGEELGVQAAVWMEGRRVVNAWAGFAGPERRQAVDAQTLFPVFSATKAVAAMAVLRLVDRGVLDLDRPLAEVWPGFACNGKQATTLRHVLNHQAGLLPPPCGSVAEYLDWEGMCRRVAAMTPDWEPGAQTRYLSLSFSWLLGEPARRATGRTLGEIVQSEICRPLRLEGLFLGLPREEEFRGAMLERGPDLPAQELDPARCWLPLEAFANRPEIRRACFPAFNLMTTADALAACYAAMLGRGADVPRLLAPEWISRIADRGHHPPDAPAQGAFCLGFHRYDLPGADGLCAFGHQGYGGSIALAVPGRKLALALVKNRTSVAQPLRRRLLEALDLPPCLTGGA